MFDSGSVQHPSSLIAGIETLALASVPKHVFKMLGLAVKVFEPVETLGNDKFLGFC